MQFNTSFTILAIWLAQLASWASAATSNPFSRINRDDVALLIVDHQTGLFQLVRDTPTHEFFSNIVGLAETAKVYNVSTILTTSAENGPNGPMAKSIRDLHPEAPLIKRPGEVNAWDNPEFREAVRATGKSQLIVTGIVTEVCVAHLAISLLEAGYDVFIAIDSSGTTSKEIAQAAWIRMTAAGAHLTNLFSIVGELQRDWRSPMGDSDVIGFVGLPPILAKYIPIFRNILEGWEYLTTPTTA